jgi:S1-C subfamily serine protease
MSLASKLFVKGRYYLSVFIFLCSSSIFAGNELANTTAKIKPAIVGVGTLNQNKSPKLTLLGTGFSILDGHYVVTNKHVVPETLDDSHKEKLVVFIGTGNTPEYREAKIIVSSLEHDLSILRIGGSPLPVFKLGSDKLIAEGSDIAFTGFPIGAVLGLYPVTHRGIVSSHTPIATPAPAAKYLNIASVKRLKNPYLVYQLDATAYPGNSGSPMYAPHSGLVHGIVNRVFIKESKESVLTKPSGISYAIPVKYLNQLISRLPN